MGLTLSASCSASRTPAFCGGSFTPTGRLETKRLALTVSDGLLNDFVMEFNDDLPQYHQDGSPTLREVVVPTTTLRLADGGL